MADLTPREEQEGWAKGFIYWGLVAAAVIAVIGIGGPLLTDYFFIPDNVGMEDTTKTPADVAEEKDVPVGVAGLGTKDSAEYGTYLTDGEGRAVYLFEGDEKGEGNSPAVSTCYEDCAKAWPPITSTDAPRTAGAVDKELIGTIERRDGTKQVTYNGWPLYHFAKDFGPQEATGQDVEDFGAEWYLVTPRGEKVGESGNAETG